VSWSRIYEIARGIAALSGLVAFVGFAYGYNKDVSVRQSNADRSWQSVAIYSHLTEARDKGVSMDELVAMVQGDMINGQAFKDVDPNIATKTQVMGGLLDLTSKYAVVMGTDGRYRVPLNFASPFEDEALRVRIRKFQDEIINLVANNPNKFSLNDLRRKLTDDGASILDTRLTLIELLSGGFNIPPVLVPSNDSVNANRSPDEQLLVIGGS
jgi:hypothetical protein